MRTSREGVTLSGISDAVTWRHVLEANDYETCQREYFQRQCSKGLGTCLARLDLMPACYALPTMQLSTLQGPEQVNVLYFIQYLVPCGR
jgi:hypothetical protein